MTPSVETGTFSAQTVASGLFNPTAIDYDNAGHMYIAQQDGIVHLVLVDERGVARSHHEAPEIDGVIHVSDDLGAGQFHDVQIVNALGPDLVAEGAAEVS